MRYRIVKPYPGLDPRKLRFDDRLKLPRIYSTKLGLVCSILPHEARVLTREGYIKPI